jgi:two-component system, cell cycle sensor histidine kinase and response regulator CckA
LKRVALAASFPGVDWAICVYRKGGLRTDADQIMRQHADSIQVLVTDMIMPKLSGAELAREVAKISQKAATLYMSGYTDRELIDYDPASSTVGFLQKPFALKTLLEKIGQMIAGRG